MSKVNKQRILAVVIILVVIWIGYLLFRTTEQAPPPITAPRTATVIINEDEFSPATLKIKAGTTVIWQNDNSQSHYIESDPYPTHTDLPGLNSKTSFGKNATYEYTFNQKGTFGYHDRLNPTYHGTIVVE